MQNAGPSNPQFLGSLYVRLYCLTQSDQVWYGNVWGGACFRNDLYPKGVGLEHHQIFETFNMRLHCMTYSNQILHDKLEDRKIFTGLTTPLPRV